MDSKVILHRLYGGLLGLAVISSFVIASHAPQDRRPRARHASFEFRLSPDSPELRHPTFQYREGPSRQGHVLSEFGRKKPKVDWVLPALNAGIHSASKASPAVDATGVYVGTDSGHFMAVNLDGTERWRFKVAKADRGIHATAALDQDTVYYGAYNGRLYAHDKVTGRLRWVAVLGQTIGSSVALRDGRVYVAVELNRRPDGFVVCLDARTGQRIWRSDFLGEQAHSSPALDPQGRHVFVGANNGLMTALDADTGQVLWQARARGPIKSTPVLIEGVVYYTSWDHLLYAADAENGRILWSVDLGSPSQSTPAYAPRDGLLIALNNRGVVSAIDRKSGEVRWQKPYFAFALSSALVLTPQGRRPSTAVVGCDRAELCGLDTRTGELLWKYPLRAVLSSVPVHFGGALFLALDAPGGLLKLF